MFFLLNYISKATFFTFLAKQNKFSFSQITYICLSTKIFNFDCSLNDKKGFLQIVLFDGCFKNNDKQFQCLKYKKYYFFCFNIKAESNWIYLQFYLFASLQNLAQDYQMEFRMFAKKIVRAQLDFSRLEKNYRIDSLALHKLNLSKILEFYRQIEVKYTFESKKGKTWFQNQLRIFIWVVFNYSNFLNKKPTQLSELQWQTISYYFHKDHLTCKYFFLCIQKNRRSQWAEDQDQFVMDHINKPSFTNEWTEIGKELFITSNGIKFKKPKQIRQRWNNYLNPNVSKDKWNIEQDITLFNLASKQGRKWALISKILKSRSQHSVKNRYTNLFKKFKTQQAHTASRFRKSQLQTEFIRYSLKKLDEQKLKEDTQENIEPRKQYKGEEKEVIQTSNNINLNNQSYSENSILINGMANKKRGHNSNSMDDWQFFNQQQIFRQDSNQNHSLMSHEKGQNTIGDSKSQGKDKNLCMQSSYQVSPQLEFIKSPIYYGQKQEDFMSAQNLMKGFQPTYHYLF